jgi:hypothetical protein
MARGGITYDGVDADLSGGTIFEGLKFWIAIRVPMRKQRVLDVLVRMLFTKVILVMPHPRQNSTQLT